MSVPKSLLSYSDCLDYFDTALRYTEGCRIPVADIGDANNLRMRLNNCRKLHREENARVYPEHNIMHGKSPYDAIVVRIRPDNEDKLYVVLDRIDISRREVEGLGEALDDDQGYLPIESSEPLQIEGPKDDELEETQAPVGLRRI